MRNLISIIILVNFCACSSSRILLHPKKSESQTVSYSRGISILQSQETLNPEFSIMDYSENEMIIGLTVTNITSEPLTISEQNLKAELTSGEEIHHAKIYDYEQLIKESADRSNENLALAGNTAAGIGAGFIPFGGIALSVGKLFYTVGNGSEEHQKRIDSFTFSQLNQHYFRLQTLQPSEKYSGFLKIGFDQNFKAKDKIAFHFVYDDQTETFTYSCKETE